jgi:hypothetical protein
MAIDFPNAPADGQTFIGPNGVTYRWSAASSLWTALATSQTLIASDTPPANPVANQLWWNATLGQLFIFYNDGNSSQWVPATPQAATASSPVAWRLLSRQTPSAVGFVELASIPTDVNELEVHFDLLPVTNDQNLMCQFYGANGALDVAGHYTFMAWGNTHTAALNTAPGTSTSGGAAFNTGILFAYAATNAQVSATSGNGIKGSFRVPSIRLATRKALMGQCYYLDGSNANMRGMSFSGDRNVSEAITGLRLSFVAGSAGNIASGTFSVWGSP